jgi:hypothetical protein
LPFNLFSDSPLFSAPARGLGAHAPGRKPPEAFNSHLFNHSVASPVRIKGLKRARAPAFAASSKERRESEKGQVGGGASSVSRNAAALTTRPSLSPCPRPRHTTHTDAQYTPSATMAARTARKPRSASRLASAASALLLALVAAAAVLPGARAQGIHIVGSQRASDMCTRGFMSGVRAYRNLAAQERCKGPCVAVGWVAPVTEVSEDRKGERERRRRRNGTTDAFFYPSFP